MPFVVARIPTGLIERRWLRNLERAAIAALALGTVCQAVAPDFLDAVGPGVAPIANPLGVDALATVTGALSAIAALVVTGFGAAALIDLVRRFFRSIGEERQQLRLIAATLVPVPITFVASLFAPDGTVTEVILVGGQVVGLTGVSVGIAVAVLRYRLYDLVRSSGAAPSTLL